MGQISGQSRVQRASDGILWRSVGSETVLVDPDSGDSFVLNRVGATVWELVDGKRTIADIASAVCDVYDVAPEIAQQGIVEWAEWLVGRGLVVVVQEPPGTV